MNGERHPACRGLADGTGGAVAECGGSPRHG